MSLLKKLGRSVTIKNVDMRSPNAEISVVQNTTSYIEIHQTNKGNCHLRIRSGNHKIKFNSENYYNLNGARRAAKRFANETGLEIVDRTK